jgi:hypothetical protein
MQRHLSGSLMPSDERQRYERFASGSAPIDIGIELPK